MSIYLTLMNGFFRTCSFRRKGVNYHRKFYRCDHIERLPYVMTTSGIGETVNVGGFATFLLRFVVWTLAGFGIGCLMVGHVGRPLLYGFFIASVLTLPILFPNFFAALGLLSLLGDIDMRDKRHRR